VSEPVAAKSERTFLGHPIGLLWLSGSEFWERFCYYGMQALLTLYLFKYLLQPGHIEQVWGFETFRHVLDVLIRAMPWLFHQTPMAYASYTSQLYAGLVFVTPLIGELVTKLVTGGKCDLDIDNFLPERKLNYAQ